MKLWRQIGVVALVPVALVGGAGNVFAQERDKNWSVTLGLKGWINTWETALSNDGGGDSNILSLTSPRGKLALIPNLAARYKDFFVSGGYFTKTSYTFPRIRDAGVLIDTKADRSEVDFNLGYFIVPQLALTVGYKTIKQEYEVSGPSFATSRSTTKYTGPTVGILGSAPIGGGFAFYGNGASSVVGLKAKYSTGGSDTAWYGSSELGLAYAVARGAVLSLGYKYQVLNTHVSTSTGQQEARDVTTGLIFGANYTF
jgi:hypothetical protein